MRKDLQHLTKEQREYLANKIFKKISSGNSLHNQNKRFIFVSSKRKNMNTYNEYKELQNKQNTIVDILSDKLNSYPKGDFGMVEESLRMSDEFRLVKSNFNKEFKKLQEINRLGMKMFKKEIRKSNEEKRNRK